MMLVMNIVWPITGLYFPIIGIWAYLKLGQNKQGGSMNYDDHEHMEHHDYGKKPFW